MADRTQSQDDPKCLKTEVNEEQIEPCGDILLATGRADQKCPKRRTKY